MTRTALLLVVPLLALTEAANANFFSHRYGGLSLGSAELDGFCQASQTSIQSLNNADRLSVPGDCDSGSEHIKLYVGWRWKPHLAFEANLQQLRNSGFDFRLSDDQGQYLNIEEEMETSILSGHAVGHLPIYAGLSAYAKVGLGFWNANLKESQRGEVLLLVTDGENIFEELVAVDGSTTVNDSGFLYSYGAGLSYRHNNSWTLRLEWENLADVGSDDLLGQYDLQTASLGWSMHF